MRDRQIFFNRALEHQVCEYQIASTKERLKPLVNTVKAIWRTVLILTVLHLLFYVMKWNRHENLREKDYFRK